MKHTKHIISIFLLFFQMISMGHIMFHHQMHALIEGESICVVFENHHDCCSGCNHSDHNNNCSHEDNCNSDREFIGEDSHRFNTADRALELPCFFAVTPTEISCDIERIIKEKFKEHNEGIPITPFITHYGLRAPPTVC